MGAASSVNHQKKGTDEAGFRTSIAVAVIATIRLTVALMVAAGRPRETVPPHGGRRRD